MTCSKTRQVWEKQFAELVKYHDENGDCLVPVRFGALGKWVTCQRKLYREHHKKDAGTRDFAQVTELESRFQRLKDIGFIFTVGKGTLHPKRRIST